MFVVRNKASFLALIAELHFLTFAAFPLGIGSYPAFKFFRNWAVVSPSVCPDSNVSLKNDPEVGSAYAVFVVSHVGVGFNSAFSLVEPVSDLVSLGSS